MNIEGDIVNSAVHNISFPIKKIKRKTFVSSFKMYFTSPDQQSFKTNNSENLTTSNTHNTTTKFNMTKFYMTVLIEIYLIYL